MAHAIDLTSIGRASYASTQREWHFNQTNHEIILPTDDAETICRKAGMEYQVQRAFVRYATERGQSAEQMRSMKDKLVLFRSDTKEPLGVVSDSYKVVQPKEVIEFFREWAAAGGVTIESAGVLFGGKRYFATAKMQQAVGVDGMKDMIVPYALLSTSADGSLATEGRWTNVRTVCNNTLTAARAGAAAFRLTHRSEWKPNEFKHVIEDARAEFSAFMETARRLAAIKINSVAAEELTMALFKKGQTDADKVRESRGYTAVMSLFQGSAKGATLETAHSTVWGWLNACTEHFDHHVRARTAENRLASALWGQGNDMKQRAWGLATALI